MSHLVLQFRCNSTFETRDFHEQRSQQRAAQLRSQTLPVPLLLAEAQHTDDAVHPPGSLTAGCLTDTSALGYRAVLGACDFVFTDDWDKGQLAGLLLDGPGLQHIQAHLQPSKLQLGGHGARVACSPDAVQLLGSSLTDVLNRSPTLEAVVLPPMQPQVRVLHGSQQILLRVCGTYCGTGHVHSLVHQTS